MLASYREKLGGAVSLVELMNEGRLYDFRLVYSSSSRRGSRHAIGIIGIIVCDIVGIGSGRVLGSIVGFAVGIGIGVVVASRRWRR
jgi:hypothetical protein